MMRAARLHTRDQRLAVEDVVAPEPGTGEVLVRVMAVGLCGTDVDIVTNPQQSFVRRDVVTLGHETAGTIEAVGSAVNAWSVGDRVIVSPILTCGRCRLCATGRGEICSFVEVLGLTRDGSLAEFVVVPEATLVHLPDAIPYRVGALLSDAVATPFHALVDRGRLQPGQTLAVVGVGGLGQHAVQLAAMLGAGKIIAVDVQASQLELASTLGATHTVDATTGDVADAIRHANGGRGVDLALDLVGKPDSVRTTFSAVTKGGRVVVVGLGREPVELPPPAQWVMREVELVSSCGFRLDTIERLVTLVASGRLCLDESISHVVRLEDVSHGLAILRDRSESPRRVVVVPTDDEIEGIRA